MRLTMQRSSPSLTSLSSLYPFNPPPCLRRQQKNQIIMRLSVQHLYHSFYKRPLCCNDNNRKCTGWMKILSKLQYCPWRITGGKLFVASSDRKLPNVRALCQPTSKNKVINSCCMNTHTYTNAYCHTVRFRLGTVVISYVCCWCRDGSGPDHMCSGPGWTWTLMGPGTCDVPLLGAPGFPTDRGVAELTWQCQSRSIPQGQSSCFERETKMAPVIGPLVTSHHTTVEGGDLVCLWIPAAACIFLRFLPSTQYDGSEWSSFGKSHSFSKNYN